MQNVKIGNYTIGKGYPTFIIAEIGINHNGNIDNAFKLIDMAKKCGCDAVKFQKREPELSVPQSHRNILRETPWGLITYLEYKKKIEFGIKEYQAIDKYCKEKDILWFATSHDIPSLHFLKQFNLPCYKISSFALTDHVMLKEVKKLHKPIILSTGMSTMEQIKDAVKIIGKTDLVLMHCTSCYPLELNEINLKCINTLESEFDIPVGYSGHEIGVFPSTTAVIYGAVAIERHITLSRAMWGTDQSASLESRGLKQMIRDIRDIPIISGDGIKRIYDREKPIIKKVRGA